MPAGQFSIRGDRPAYAGNDLSRFDNFFLSAEVSISALFCLLGINFGGMGFSPSPYDTATSYDFKRNTPELS